MFPVGPAGNPVQVDPKVIFDNFRWITSTRNLHGRPKAAGTRMFGLIWLNAAIDLVVCNLAILVECSDRFSGLQSCNLGCMPR